MREREVMTSVYTYIFVHMREGKRDGEKITKIILHLYQLLLFIYQLRNIKLKCLLYLLTSNNFFYNNNSCTQHSYDWALIYFFYIFYQASSSFLIPFTLCCFDMSSIIKSGYQYLQNDKYHPSLPYFGISKMIRIAPHSGTSIFLK